MRLLFYKLRVVLLHLKKQSIAIKTDVKIPSLLPSIFGQSTMSTRTMQIFMDIGVSLLRFKYPATLRKTSKSNSINYISPKYVFIKIYPFPYPKNKSKEFYCPCYVFKLLLPILFFIFIFLVILFLIFKENTI